MTRVFEILFRLRFFVVAFWLIAAGAALWPAMHFIGVTTQQFTAPEGTPSWISRQLFEAHFPAMSATSLIAALVTRFPGDNRTVLGGFAMNLTSAIRDRILPASDPQPGSIRGVLGYYTLRENFTMLADSFVSPDQRATLIAVPVLAHKHSQEWSIVFREKLDEWVAGRPEKAEFRVDLVGAMPLFQDIVAGAQSDTARMDSVALPLALLVLTIVLGSLPAVVLPVISVAIAFSLSFAVMYFVARYVIDVAGFTPSVMLSVMIATAFDNSLFLLSRYREELTARRCDQPSGNLKIFHRPLPVSSEANAMCVEITLLNAGRIVATSGAVLFACFAGMAALPMSVVATFGLGASVSIFFTIFISLTFIPSALLILRPVLSLDGFIPGIDIEAVVRRCFRCHAPAVARKRRGFWRWLGDQMTRQPHGIISIGVSLAILIPLCAMALGIRISKDTAYMTPDNSPALIALRHMQSTSFPPGLAEPYKVLIVPKPTAPTGKNGSRIWSRPFFDESFKCIEELCTSVGGLGEDHVTGVMLANGLQVDFEFAEKLVDPKSGWYHTDVGVAFRQLVSFLVSSKQEASLVIVPTMFNPTTNVTKFVRAAHTVLNNCTGNFTYHLAGNMPTIQDAVAKVLGVFPVMAAVTCGAVFVFLLIAYRTVILPFRTLSTIALTLGSAYGCGTMVFCNGWFNFTSSIIAAHDSFFWFTVVSTFVITVGLALDYDLFIFTRIFENRSKGMDTKEAISDAVGKAGKVITYAGLIMAIAFGGLCLSSIITVIQIGFMLMVAVLIDTFIVRSLFVPPVLSLLGEINWWPRKFPIASDPGEREKLFTGSISSVNH